MAKKGLATFRAPGLSARQRVPPLHTNLKPPPPAKKALPEKKVKKKKGDESYSDEEKVRRVADESAFATCCYQTDACAVTYSRGTSGRIPKSGTTKTTAAGRNACVASTAASLPTLTTTSLLIPISAFFLFTLVKSVLSQSIPACLPHGLELALVCMYIQTKNFLFQRRKHIVSRAIGASARQRRSSCVGEPPRPSP